MAKFLIATSDLAPFMAAKPSILVVDADAAPFNGLGIDVWYGRQLPGGRARVERSPAASESEEDVEIPMAPSGTLVLFLGKDAPAVLWQEWFAATQGQQAPEVVTDHATALRVISARLLAERNRIACEHADLHLAMARLRQDLDQMRMVATGPLAQQRSGGLTLLIASEPARASIRLDDKNTTLVQPLATRLDRIVAVAVAVLAVKGEVVLRARLSAVESGRIFGSWLVPPGSLATCRWRRESAHIW